MERLRTLFLIIALVLIFLVVLLEVGALGLLRGSNEAITAAKIGELIPASGEVREAFDDIDPSARDELARQDRPPGLGIPYLALVDGTLFFTVGLIGVSLLIRERLHARIQGIATLLFSLLVILAAIAMLIAAIILVLLMVVLLLAVPFGTIVYLAVYGFFNRGGASIALSLLMTLKLGFAICLVLAQQRFLQNKGLVLLVVTSFLANLIVSFLHVIVPLFLVSITDAIAAIIGAILGIIWAIVLLIGSLLSVIKALRFDRV